MYLDFQKKYKISGLLLKFIMDLSTLYEQPLLCDDGKTMQVIPFPKEQRDYLIGRIVSEFEKCEWEEV